ncbi:MAG: hypothetical protein ACKO7W_07460 [Elainella sp.]
MLIQLDGRLLWQILVEADPIALQALDELLLILAGDVGLAMQTPVAACCTEADWLRAQIRSHYPFDLAEELLLRLDGIRFEAAEAHERVYATLTEASSLAEFLELYHTICSLELLYKGLAESNRSGLQGQLGTNGFQESQEAQEATAYHFTKPQARVLLVSLALLLALLPHWTRLQEVSLAQAANLDAANPDAADPSPTNPSPANLLVEIRQSARQWLQLALGPDSPPSSPAPPVTTARSQSGENQLSKHQNGEFQHPRAKPFGSGSMVPQPTPDLAVGRSAPVGQLSPLIHVLGEDLLARTAQNTDLATRSGKPQEDSASSEPSVPSAPAETPSQVADGPERGKSQTPRPVLPAAEAAPATPVQPDPVQPDPVQPDLLPAKNLDQLPEPPQPVTPSSPSQLADSRPSLPSSSPSGDSASPDLTIAQRNLGPSDPLLGAVAQTGPLTGNDPLLSSAAAVGVRQTGVANQAGGETGLPVWTQLAESESVLKRSGLLQLGTASGETASLAWSLFLSPALPQVESRFTPRFGSQPGGISNQTGGVLSLA